MTGEADRPDAQNAFTLIELLVVIAIIGILASLLLPTLYRARADAEGIRCMVNLKQFSLAWLSYADDFGDTVPPNLPWDTKPDPVLDTWVRGWLDIATANWRDNTNTEYLRESLLGPYLGRSVDIWRCPADHSRARFDDGLLPRVRSYSMNGFMNSFDDVTGVWKTIRKTSDMVEPHPCQTFVFIDERDDSIEDCVFGVDMFNGPASFGAVPRCAHNGAGTLSFADGHGELKRWLDPRTEPPMRPNAFVEIRATWSPPNPDVLWIRARTTGRIK